MRTTRYCCCCCYCCCGFPPSAWPGHNPLTVLKWPRAQCKQRLAKQCMLLPCRSVKQQSLFGYPSHSNHAWQLRCCFERLQVTLLKGRRTLTDWSNQSKHLFAPPCMVTNQHVSLRWRLDVNSLRHILNQACMLATKYRSGLMIWATTIA